MPPSFNGLNQSISSLCLCVCVVFEYIKMFNFLAPIEFVVNAAIFLEIQSPDQIILRLLF
jgi:hypothetical protein